MSLGLSILCFFLIAGILTCILLIIVSLSASVSLGKPPAFPASAVLNKDEAALYKDLCTVCEQTMLLVFAKVSVGSALNLKIRNAEAHAKALSGESLDFVLCDPRTLKPVLVLFLRKNDDASKKRHGPNINAVLDTAGIPYITIKDYTLSGLETAIRDKLSGNRS